MSYNSLLSERSRLQQLIVDEKYRAANAETRDAKKTHLGQCKEYRLQLAELSKTLKVQRPLAAKLRREFRDNIRASVCAQIQAVSDRIRELRKEISKLRSDARATVASHADKKTKKAFREKTNATRDANITEVKSEISAYLQEKKTIRELAKKSTAEFDPVVIVPVAEPVIAVEAEPIVEAVAVEEFVAEDDAAADMFVAEEPVEVFVIEVPVADESADVVEEPDEVFVVEDLAADGSDDVVEDLAAEVPAAVESEPVVAEVPAAVEQASVLPVSRVEAFCADFFDNNSQLSEEESKESAPVVKIVCKQIEGEQLCDDLFVIDKTFTPWQRNIVSKASAVETKEYVKADGTRILASDDAKEIELVRNDLETVDMADVGILYEESFKSTLYNLTHAEQCETPFDDSILADIDDTVQPGYKAYGNCASFESFAGEVSRSLAALAVPERMPHEDKRDFKKRLDACRQNYCSNYEKRRTFLMTQFKRVNKFDAQYVSLSDDKAEKKAYAEYKAYINDALIAAK